MRNRGLTMMEVLVSVAVLAFGTFVVIGTFSQNLRHSSQSRQRMMAALVMENLVEEVLAHPYGMAAPTDWKDDERDLTFIVEGRPQITRFTCNVAQNAEDGNGSFFGKAESSTDLVTLSVAWSESSGLGNASQNHDLSLDLVVRREP